MSITFNNEVFSGAKASIGAIATVPFVGTTFAGTSITGQLGATTVTVNGTIAAPNSTATISIDAKTPTGAAAIELTAGAATYVGYFSQGNGQYAYYFNVTGIDAVTKLPVDVGVAVSEAGVPSLAGVAATPLTPAHGSAPDSLPQFHTASADGASVTLTYNKPLNGADVPPVGAFTVAAGGAADAVTGVAVSGNTLTLALATPVTSGQTVTVAYGVPGAGGALAVQDLSGTVAAALPATAALNATAAVTVPVGTTTGAGGTTPVTVTTGAGGTTVTTPVGIITVPVGTTAGSGGTTITTPAGPVTVPTGGTITMTGAGGGSTSLSPVDGGASTVTTVSPTGAQTTQTIPSGSTIAAGTGLAAGDVISIDPNASFGGHGSFTIGGHVAAGSGVSSVTISAVVDGAATATVLGTAAVAADGSYSFVDKVGPHLQAFLTATEADDAGGSASVQSPYSLQGGLDSQGGIQGAFRAEQDLYTPDGDSLVALTSYRGDGSRRVDVLASGQTFKSDFFDVFNDGGAPSNTFVFDPGHGLDVVTQFRANGADHDTISLPASDFTDLADVLGHTRNTAAGAVILDPVSGDTVLLAGVKKAEISASPADIKLHA